MISKKAQLWIERKTSKRLWDVLSIYPSTFDNALRCSHGADDLGDYLLNSVIDERYPEEKKLREAKDKAEKDAALRVREESAVCPQDVANTSAEGVSKS